MEKSPKDYKIVYVAGRYRAPTPWGVRQNIEAAARLAATVWAAGAVALCPHLNAAHMEGVVDEETFINGTLALMMRCDAVITVEGWEHSVGAQAEVEMAHILDMPVFHDIGAMWEWLNA